MIGYVVIAIIATPVVVLITASILEEPRVFRVSGLFLGSFILLVGALISGFAIIGALLGFIVPK